jgi:hypothetical protein
MRRAAATTAAVLALGVCASWRGVSAAPEPSITFAKDVAPILHAKCVTCHRAGEVAPMPLLTYEDARPWVRSIKAKVAARQMPPWFADPAYGSFANDARLTDAEISTITRWADAGAPMGNAKDMPAMPTFTDGWQLGEPDYIINLPEVQIPAEGGDYFPTPNITVDIPEDHWVRAIEIRPSNREVTHHSVIFSTSASILNPSGFFDVLGVWAVGTPPTVYPEGLGRWVRKGQQLRTNLHYHPNGKPQVDRTRVGLYFGKGELRKEVTAGLAGNVTFSIPPGATNHELRAVYPVDQDITVVSLFPHMHLRGKDMKLTATYPDGRQETLLNVPAYDFNWQLFYYPKHNVKLPAGSRVDLVAHYDNSAANKNNPDPTKAVRFGEASTAEMMFGMFEFTADAGVSPKPSNERTRMEALMQTLPKDSAYLVQVPFAKQPTSLVFELPKTGDGVMYASTFGVVINPVKLNGLKWTGDSFEFLTALGAGPGAGFYTVTGTVAEDGTLKGEMRRRGNTQPPSYDFTGTRGPLRSRDP